MLTRLFKIVFYGQKILFEISYWLIKIWNIIFRIKRDNYKWVFGVEEIANNLFVIGGSIDSNITVCLTQHRFYNKNSYTYKIALKGLMYWPYKILYGPILFAYLINRNKNFFYIAGEGFLINKIDGRCFEFSKIKKSKGKIVCLFCGSEIRSHKLTNELGNKMNIDTIITYQMFSNKNINSNFYENIRKQLARSADNYADLVFNAPVDQVSYLKGIQTGFYFFLDDLKFKKNPHKFNSYSRPIIVHGPSNPFIKATPIVRAAIKKLELEGYDFEYRELINIPNDEMLQNLCEAHIVLNEFYAFTPGLFGVEAMASYCALLTSGDEFIEPTLPKGCNNAWMVTKYWEIYDNLRYMLDNPTKMPELAERGYQWAYDNCRTSVSKMRLKNTLNNLLQDNNN